MSRVSAFLALFGLVLLASASVASAALTVGFKAEPVPIKGFPHTGNILGAGAAVRAEYSIAGTEYGGFPPPLIGIKFYLPTGTKLHTAGFQTCAKSTLERTGSSACSQGSAAGPSGKALAIVAFGAERVEEPATLDSFYAPGGILFLTSGYSPVTLEILSSGHYVNLGGGGGYGPELIATVPLVSTVPDAPYASVESISVTAGSARKVRGKPIYYSTMPKACPKHGFPLKTELTFAEGGEVSKPVTVTKTYDSPCPRR